MNIAQSSWLQVLLVILLYVFIINTTQLLRRLITAIGTRNTANVDRRFDQVFIRILGSFLLIIEPVFIVIVTILIVTINPIIYGTVLLFLYVTLFTTIKNYFIGRLLLFNGDIKKNQKIKIIDKIGYLTKLGKFDISLRTPYGIDHVPYEKLSVHGFAILSGSDLGHMAELNLSPKPGTNMSIERLRSLLSTSPYLSAEYVPLIAARDDITVVKLLLDDEKYLTELIPVLNSWGWSLVKTSTGQNNN